MRRLSTPLVALCRDVLGSEWLSENWKRVALALTVVRSGHRSLGHRVTGLIHKAAIGNLELSTEEEMFLDQLGITLGKLQVVRVEEVIRDARTVPVARIGQVIPV